MSDVADYDTDILLWSERQAALLRALKVGAHATRRPPISLDILIRRSYPRFRSEGRPAAMRG